MILNRRPGGWFAIDTMSSFRRANDTEIVWMFSNQWMFLAISRVVLFRCVPLLFCGIPVLAQQAVSASERISDLNARLAEMANAEPADAGLNQAFAERTNLLRELIAERPLEAAPLQLPKSLTAKIRAVLPQVEVEEEGDWSGSIQAYVEDNFDAKLSRMRYFFRMQPEPGMPRSVEASLEVFFGPGDAPGGSVPFATIHGIRAGDVLAAVRYSLEASPRNSGIPPAAAVAALLNPECTVTGVQNVAVVLVTTPSNPSFPVNFDRSYFEQAFFGPGADTPGNSSLNRLIQEMSDGKTSVIGQVFGPYALPQDYTCSQTQALLTAAIAAADGDIDFTLFRSMAVIFPISTCTFGGSAYEHCLATPTADGTIQVAPMFFPIQPFQSQNRTVGVFTHEFGHNLGLLHAGSADHDNTTLGLPGQTGTIDEYGDPFSMMGQMTNSYLGQYALGQYSAPHKSLILGWLGLGDYLEVQSSGTFTLTPYELPAGLRALRVLRDPSTSEWLWIESRQPVGSLDRSLDQLRLTRGSNIFDGVLIHHENPAIDGARSNLLDFTTNSTFFLDDFLDAALTPGHTWTDPYSPLRIEVTSVGALGSSVTVTYDQPCTNLHVSAASFASGGGSGTITVTAPADCAWTASSGASWITATGSGQGNGEVPFTISTNFAGQRSGYVIFQRQSVRLTQEGTISSVISVTPNRGTGASGQFTFKLADASSYQNISVARMAFSDTNLYRARTCMIEVRASLQQVMLMGDAGDNPLPPISLQIPGQSASNSQCTIYSTGSSARGVDRELTITLQVAFSPSFNGTHRIMSWAPPLPQIGVALGMWTVAVGCNYSLDAAGQSFSAADGDGTVGVTAPRGCSWTATSDAAWLTVTSGSTGAANGAVGFSVASNTSLNTRTGTLTIGGHSFLVQQAGNCGFALPASLISVGPGGVNATAEIRAAPGCAWTATSDAAWLTVASGGSGNGFVTFNVAPLGSAAPRTGTLNIMGLTFTVQQWNACAYVLDGTGFNFGGSGGTARVSVTAPFGCLWTAASNAAWLTISSGGSGNGDGTVAFHAASLGTGAPRAGALMVAGLPFPVQQSSAVSGAIAQIASAGTWKMILTYLNLGAVAAQARTEFAGNNSGALTLPLSFPQQPGPSTITASVLDRNVNPEAQLVVESTGPDAAPTLEGWGQLTGGAGITGFGIFRNVALKWEAVVPLETRNASRYVMAFDNTGAIATGLAIANLENAARSVTVVIRDAAGTLLLTTTLALAARGHTSLMLADSYPVTAGQRGTVEFQTPAGGRISVLGLRANGPALTTLPVLANVGTDGGSIAHALFNGGFTNSFTLVNTGTAPAPAILSFYDESGAALTTPVFLPQTSEFVTAAAVTRNLAPGASLLIASVGDENLPVVVGSASLTTTGNVGAFSIFRWTQFGQEASVPLEDRIPGSFVLVFDNTSGLTTGLAMANAANTGASIMVRIRDESGDLLMTIPMDLQANGHTSFMLPDIFGVAAGKRGTIEFVTPPGGRISVIGLRATEAGNLTTIPVLAK